MSDFASQEHLKVITKYVTDKVIETLTNTQKDISPHIDKLVESTSNKISENARAEFTNILSGGRVTISESDLDIAQRCLNDLPTGKTIEKLTSEITNATEQLDQSNNTWPWQYWIICATGAFPSILIIALFIFIYNTKPSNLEIFTTNTTEALNKLDPIIGSISDVKNTNKKIEKSVETLTTNITNFINTPKQPTGKDAMVQIDPNIATQLVALKTELSQLKGSIPSDISSKLEQLSKSVNNMSSAPAAPAIPATTAAKPTNIEFDAKKLKEALNSEFKTLTNNQSTLIKQIETVSSSVSGMAQMKADLDKINKIIGAQQEAKKEPKYQPVFLVVLSKGLNPQRDTLLLIFQKLLTLASDSPSKTSPTILVSANGNRQNVLSMSGYNQSTITTWHDSIDLREIKVPFDFLPTIINDKAGNSGQPKHVVVLAGHNYQLDKTKDLSAWDKIEKLTFVFVEPPFLSNLLWENFQKIQGLRRLKNLQTDVRIIKSMKDFGDNFKLEVDEVDDITRVMKAALAD